MKLTELHITGYRSLADVRLSLRPLMVMIGPNGSGKSSVLELFQLLRDATQEELAKSLARLGGLNAVLSKLTPPAEALALELKVNVESHKSTHPMCYTIGLTPTSVGYHIANERLEWRWDVTKPDPFYYINAQAGKVQYRGPDATGPFSPDWEYDRAELALAQVPRQYTEPDALRVLLSKTDFFSFLDVSRRAVVRLPQALMPAKRPGANGENLYSALYNLRTEAPRIYNRILDVLRAAFPGFQGLEFPVVGAGQVTLAWRQEPLATPLYPGDLSEGTLRFLWLVTVLLSSEPAALTLIDEPEVSLHPELIRLLAALLQDAALRGTVMVATHSADLIRWLQPTEVLVLDKEDGQTRASWADEMDLDEWLKEYSLSDLWQMGTMGGR